MPNRRLNFKERRKARHVARDVALEACAECDSCEQAIELATKRLNENYGSTILISFALQVVILIVKWLWNNRNEDLPEDWEVRFDPR